MKAVLCCVLVLALLHTGAALQCYMCFNSNCTDTTSCSGSCMKTVTSAGNTGGTILGCSPIANNGGCTRRAAGGASAEICFCNSDLCNNAAGAVLSLPLLGLAYFVNRLL